jgi:hypothetical protein
MHTTSKKSGLTSAMDSAFKARFQKIESTIKKQQAEIEKFMTTTLSSNQQLASQLQRLDLLDNRLLKQEKLFGDLEEKMV